MIRIISRPEDTRGFDQDQLFRVYETPDEHRQPKLVALASSVGEALDAKEMLSDLGGWQRMYQIVAPKALAN